MLANKRLYLIIATLFILTTLYMFHSSSGSSQARSRTSRQRFVEFDLEIKGAVYEQSCMDLYHKLRYPNMSLFFNPALKEPPPDLLDEFQQHGKMPIKKWWYINEVYSDSKGDQNKNKRVINKKEIDDLVNQVKVCYNNNSNTLASI